MSKLNDYISEDDLERKMEKVLVHEKGRLDETCTECEGLIICHTEECEKGVKKYDKAKVNALKLELLEKMEDFRMRKSDDMKTEKLVKGIVESNSKLVRDITEIFVKDKKDGNETVITKPKPPPMWGDEEFERYEEEVKHWNEESKNSEYNKYRELIEVLKKKKGLKEHTMNAILHQSA